MSWTAYDVVLRVLTPIHIGAAKLGNLQTTRPYVHAKATWGGLTARLTRDNAEYAGDYPAIGRRVNEELALSYFFPTAGEGVSLWPWDDPDQFAWHYLGSYTSTALNYRQNSAEEGSLHEVEYIAPTTRDRQQVYLVGHILVQDGCSLPWQQALERLQLGGERTYGWGRVAVSQPLQTTTRLFNRYDIDLSGSRPSMTLGAGDHLLAHTLVGDPQAVSATGRLVPVVGRETVEGNAHGRHLSAASICWEPGSTVTAPVTVRISRYGFWDRADG